MNNFDNDIFISYSHIDNSTLDGSEGWVDVFHKKLKFFLTKCIGQADLVEIYRDNFLRGNDEFDTVLERNICNSGFFIAITSSGYLNSEYCNYELQQFYEMASSSNIGLSIDGKYRIYNVLISNIHHNKFPEQFGRTVCFKFHDDSGWPIEIDKLDNPVKELAKAIHETMDQMNNSQPDYSVVDSGDNESLNSNNKSLPIFFADVPDSLLDDRQRAMTELSDEGYTILNTFPPPYETESHDEKVIQAAQTSFLSIHLFDQFPTRKLETGSLSYDQHQLELCQSYGSTQWIWLPAELEIKKISNTDHQEFLRDIEQRQNQSSYSFVHGNKISITRGIKEKIQELIKESERPELSMVFNKVLLSVNQKDSDDADSLINFFGMNNIITLMDKISDNPMEKQEDFEKQLCQTGTLVLVFNRVSFDWVIQRMMIAYQYIVVNNYPVQTFAIYDPKSIYRETTLSIHPLIQERVSICEQPQSLLDCIQQSRGAQ